MVMLSPLRKNMLMRKKTILSTIVLLHVLTLSIAQIAELDVRHIALDLKFDWAKKQALGIATLDLSLLSAGDKIQLDAADMEIVNVMSKGRPLKFEYARDSVDNQLMVLLGRRGKASDAMTISVQYKTLWHNATDPQNIGGSTGKGLRFLGPSSSEPQRRRQIWSMGEGQGNRYWFPCKDEPGDLRTTELKATVASEFTVISNGELLSKSINNDGTYTFHYRMDSPYPNAKTAIAIGEYAEIINRTNGVWQHQYAYPDEIEATAATIERLPDMLYFFCDYTGKAYPYQSYSQVFVQELPWGAGSGSMSVLTENMIDDHGTHADFLYLWDMLEGEALAHQWFGNFISLKTWNDYWLEKAFGRHFSCLYDEHANTKAEYLLWQHPFDMGNYFNDWNNGNRQPIVPKKIEDLYSFINGNYVNSRGALVLNMLRHHVGEDHWKQTMRAYVRQYGGQTVTTEDFIRVVEMVSGEDLDWFFEQWVYRIGHPVFEVIQDYDATKQRLTLTVHQVQERDSTSSFPQQDYFKGKVNVEIDNRIESIVLQAKKENVFTFACDQAPKLVNFDYEKVWISLINHKKSLAEYIYELRHSRDVLAQRNAIQQLANLGADTTLSEADRGLIYQNLREFVQEDRYWRIRNQALGALQRLMTGSCGDTPCLLDEPTIDLLLRVIEKDEPWVRTTAIFFLGATRDPKYADLYIRLFQDKSDRVTNAAAIALGKSKSPKAYTALTELRLKPSWKNQSLISALYGLGELGDPRGVDFALSYIKASNIPHWTLAVPIWDHRIAAALALVKLDAADKAFPIINTELDRALAEDHTNDIFFNLMQVSNLKDPRGKVIFERMKEKYKNDTSALKAIEGLEW
jgi:aminopeptidase N